MDELLESEDEELDELEEEDEEESEELELLEDEELDDLELLDELEDEEELELDLALVSARAAPPSEASLKSALTSARRRVASSVTGKLSSYQAPAWAKAPIFSSTSSLGLPLILIA